MTTEKRAYAVVVSGPFGYEFEPESVLSDTFEEGDEVEIRLRAPLADCVCGPFAYRLPGGEIVHDDSCPRSVAGQLRAQKPPLAATPEGSHLQEALELNNDLLGLLADERDHTLKLAMLHGYDLDDVESFRLSTRCNELKERLDRNKARLLAGRASLAATPEGPDDGQLPLGMCARDLVEDCAAPNGDSSRCEDEDCPLKVQRPATPEGQEVARATHECGKCKERYRQQESGETYIPTGNGCPCNAPMVPLPTAGREAPSALPEMVFCGNIAHPPSRHRIYEDCVNPRPAPGASSDEPRAAPLAAPAEPEMLGKEEEMGTCGICGEPRPECRRKSLASFRNPRTRTRTQEDNSTKGGECSSCASMKKDLDAARVQLNIQIERTKSAEAQLDTLRMVRRIESEVAASLAHLRPR